MITEDYVSYESAKLLKEKGFEYNPDESYWLIDADNKMYWISRIGAYDYVDTPTESFQRPKNGYRLITQAMAMKWLRNVHDIACSVGLFTDLPEMPPYWSFNILNQSTANVMYEAFDVKCETYEEACESAIKYCLENLI